MEVTTDTGIGPQEGEKLYQLTPDQYEAALDKLSKLQAAARKIGVTPIALVKLDEILVPYHRLDAKGNPDPTEYLRLEFVCLLTGTTPRIVASDGREWLFVGTVQHEATGNVIKLAPQARNTIDTSAYRETYQKCDHCGKYRNRKDTYLVTLGANDPLLQVGSSCIKDFLGHGDPEQVMFYVQHLMEMIEDLDGITDNQRYHDSDPRKDYFDTQEFLTHVACMVRLHGWLSKGKAIDGDGISTVERAWHNIHQFGERNSKYNDYEPPTAEDATTAQQAHRWLVEVFAAKPVADRSEFEHNLIVAASGRTFEMRLGGFVGYVIQAHHKAMEDAIVASRTKRLNKFVGDVGDKLTLRELTVVRVLDFDNSFDGVTHKHIFNDRHGNTYVWNTSSVRLEQGGLYDVTATIKDHQTYRDTNQTILTRCKCVRREHPDAASPPTSIKVNLNG